MNRVSDNKRIAKNTIFLYIRMIVIMVISLFTTREILRILGVEDYGVYNVVAGIVVLFAFLRSALIRASQRYLSYDIGIGDENRIRKTFSMSLNANLCISFVVVVLAETVGFWFVNTYLKIPEEKLLAANIVYQFSILTFIIDITRITFNSAIISYERMSFYAYISIVEAVLKLLIVYFLTLSDYDKLITYAFLLFCVSLIIMICYIVYCNRSFYACRYEKVWDKNYFRELMSFSGWSMLSGVANLSARQGGNIILNIFSGLAANASFGIASQVSHAVFSLSESFQSAFAPQITKLYAVNENKALFSLINRTSLASYYLMLILMVPFIFKVDSILGIWLDKVPEYAAGFCIWMMVYELIDASQAPLIQLIYSTGRIKGYTIWLSSLVLLNIPLSLLLLYLGASVYVVLIMRAAINFVTAVIRVIYIKTLVDFSITEFFINVVTKIVVSTFLALLLSYIFTFLFSSSSLVKDIIYLVFSFVGTFSVIALFGISRNERKAILYMIENKMRNKNV